MKKVMCVAVLLAACGGGGKKAPVTEGTDRDPDETAQEPVSSNDPTQVSPEQADEIQRLLDRRRPAVSRCLGFAIDNKELPKNARGKVAVGIVVGTNGKADSVKIVNSTLESKSLTDCVQNKVHEIAFPDIPKPYETTYTYAFEAL